MAPPFKLTPQPGDPGISRAPDGKFQAREVASPQRIASDARTRDVDTNVVLSERRAAEHPVPRGAPRNEPNETPWGDLGATYNDARRSPMKLT